MSVPIEKIRNIALFGHGGSGKTALVDALAVSTGISSRHGDPAQGTSISDSEPEEKEKKHTLTSHLFRFPIDEVELNLIDNPGHPDFLADSISSFQVVETAILCVNAASGVTFHARQLWEESGKASLGRAIVVTHPDGENADFDKLLAELTEVFGDVVVPMTYPDQSGTGFNEVHDVLSGDGPKAAEYKEKLEDRVAVADDTLLEAYLESGEISAQDLEDNFPRAIVKGTIVPLFTVCPPKEKGLHKLTALIKKDLPSPLAFGARGAAEPGSDNYGQLVEPTTDGPFAAKVFKVVTDPYVGRMSYLRCFRGTVTPDCGFLNVRTGKHDRLSGLLGLKGAGTTDIKQIGPGDLFVVAKLDDLNLWDTVTADDSPLQFKRPSYPDPIYALAVQPKARGDEQKINESLEKLAIEDPTFHVSRHLETHELVVSGLSPLHLEVQFERLQRRFGVGTHHSLPKIPYRETIIGKADGHHRHRKQSGGRGQFAEVYLRAAASERGSGFEFVDGVVGGSVPRQFIPEVEKGIRKLLEHGGLAGYPLVDVKAELYDGKFHPVDSDQLSFQLAGERAFLEAFHKAKPVLLEPVMDVEIRVPERFTGDVAGNLSSQRGRMSGMELENQIQIIKAQVPLKEMQDYSTQLRSITAGEGTFSMSSSHYELVPGILQAEIVAAHKKEMEAH